MRIITQPVSIENFKKFGKIVQLPALVPTSQSQDYQFWSNIANYHIEGNTEIGICTVYKQERNQISSLERHLNTPEILIPYDAPFVLPLHKDGDNISEAGAFKVEIGEAVVINPGIWHGACLPVESNTASYFVIFKQETPFNDIEKMDIELMEITM